jgi:serine protease AprX
MTRVWSAALVLALLFGALVHPAHAQEPCAGPGTDGRRGVTALRGSPPAEVAVGIAVHTAAPDATSLTRLRALGLHAQPLRHLPLTLLAGPTTRLVAAADLAGVADVYPDRPLRWTSRESAAAIGADTAWSAHGVTGAGVGIAVVDSGIDATHPAFEGRVRRNVKMVGPEYLTAFGLPAGEVPVGNLAIPVDEGPYSNTDAFGHGTIVAGIAAAGDVGGNDDDSPVGVAPGAHLIGYAVGEAHVFSVLAAFDDILATHTEHNIRVVNNSWGDRFELFDPDAPLNIATRALHDAGIVTTFAAGNDAEQMTLSAPAAAPWVISVGSAMLTGAPAPASSGGMAYDNSELGPAGRQRFTGDGIGLYHPSVTAPGTKILSTATPSGIAMSGPQPPGGTSAASGTSVATPHVAGVTALLLEARPELTPEQVKHLLQATARPAPGWQVWKAGFGFVDAAAAVAMAADINVTSAEITAVHAHRTAALLARRDRPVLAADHVAMTAQQQVAAGGLETHCVAVEVMDEGVRTVRVALRYAGTVEQMRNTFRWSLDVRDAAGAPVGRQRVALRNGITTVDVDITDAVALGTWTVTATADLAASAPRPLLTPSMSLVVTQLGAVALQPSEHTVRWHLAPRDGSQTAVMSPEGCAVTQPPAAGALTTEAGTSCAAAAVGVDAKDAAGMPTFVTAPLPQPLHTGGAGTLVLSLADELAPTRGAVVGSRVFYALHAVDPAGGAAPLLLASGQPDAQLADVALPGTYSIDVREATVPAGWVVQLEVFVSGAGTVATRLLYGGEHDSSVVLPVLK